LSVDAQPDRPAMLKARTIERRPLKLDIGSAYHRQRCPPSACAVTRRRFPVGASPTRQMLQPEAIGADREVTNWLKPSMIVSRIGDRASVQAATRVNAEQASKRTMCRPTRLPFRGRLTRTDARARPHPFAAPGYWRQHVHKESARNTGSPSA
jgi:hypothetical protein